MTMYVLYTMPIYWPLKMICFPNGKFVIMTLLKTASGIAFRTRLHEYCLEPSRPFTVTKHDFSVLDQDSIFTTGEFNLNIDSKACALSSPYSADY